ncbi:MAG: hypothetical protein R3C18_04610 [Planctomycetaceae bacterium]
MNRNLLLSLVAGVDIWVILFILHQHPPTNSDLLLTIRTKQSQALPPDQESIQIWIRRGTLGLYPDTETPWTLDKMGAYLDRQSASGRPVDVRLLCERTLTLDDWREVASELSIHADSLRLAPLPEE